MNGLTRNVRTTAFKEQFGRLPDVIQRLAVAAFKVFCEDPSHPALRQHSLKDNKIGQHKPGSFSVSITMKYRAIYTRDGDTNVWYWIGTHADYDNFIGDKSAGRIDRRLRLRVQGSCGKPAATSRLWGCDCRAARGQSMPSVALTRLPAHRPMSALHGRSISSKS